MAAEIRVVAWGSPLATCCFELIFPQGRRVQLANTTTTTTTTATAQQRYNKLQQPTGDSDSNNELSHKCLLHMKNLSMSLLLRVHTLGGHLTNLTDLAKTTPHSGQLGNSIEAINNCPALPNCC